MRKVGSAEAISESTIAVPSIFDLKYTPTVLSRYPKTNYSPEEPFPAYAAMVRQKQPERKYHF
jgi:hypothetical protein